MVKAELLEEVRGTLQELAQLASDGAMLVVEGKRDVESLERLGIAGRFFTLLNGNRLIENIEVLAREREVVMLVDFDRRGRELLTFCRRHLGARGVRLNVEIWERLRALAGRQVKDIEGLATYLDSGRKP
jgi:5S rRNA maturation endonuclease (ribonuclease M5)